MANENVNVNFRPNGTDLASYMDRLAQRAAELNRQALQSAQQQTSAAREQLKIMEQLIAAQQRKNSAEASSARQAADQARVNRLDVIESSAAEREKKIKDDFSAGRITEQERDKRFERLGSSIDAQTKEADKQYRDQLKSIREQERQNATLLRLQKDNLDTLKQTSKEQVNQLKKGDRDVVDALHQSKDPLDQLAARAAEEEFEQSMKPDAKKVGAKDIIGSIFSVDNLNKLLASFQTFTSTQNGFDLIKPAAQASGQIIGSIIGGLIGGLTTGGAGALVGMGIGGSVGSALGGGIGEFEQRRAMAIQEFQASQNRYRALTIQQGFNSIPDMSFIGMSGGQYMDLLRTSALRRGNIREAAKTAEDIAYITKGTGVDQSTLLSLTEVQRSNKENNRDLANLIGNVIGRGTAAGIFQRNDIAFLDEFLNKFAQVQKDFLKNQTVVGTATTMDIMTRIGGLGGMFDLKDPRSLSNLGAIQSGLTNPGSDSLKALSFLTLRRLMPNAGIFDILRAQQQGLSGPQGMQYLQGVLGFANQLGGDDDMRRLMISGAFPGLSLDAVDTLFQNQGKLKGPISRGFLEGSASRGSFEILAQENTTVLERNIAEIQNGLLGAWNVTLNSMAGAFENAIRQTLSGATIQMQNGRLVIPGGGQAQPVQQNSTMTPSQYRTQGVVTNPNWTQPNLGR